jgi:hypothetical protein
MRLVALEIPDDSAELPGWLEGQLLGLDLAALIAELEAVQGGRSAESVPLDRLLGTDRGAVLERGLSALSPERLRAFLRHPRQLLDLQELLLVEGEAYWQRLAAVGSESAALGTLGWRRLDAFLRTGDAAAPSDVAPRVAARRSVSRWVVILATAASLLVGVALYQRESEPTSAVPPAGNWGWLRPGALTSELPRSEYLNRLAVEAGEWFARRPDQPAALARRIAELRQGCSAVILAAHRPLSPQDRQWLVRTCREWATKLDQHLADLESGTDLRELRVQVDETVRRIVQSLRNRAATPT